jgi:ABC-type multidrug transport system ATPase subunit
LCSPQLTGGQKKRVSIGLGLVGQPDVLFLDEPTTGLDSSAALNIVKYISAVAKATNVVCIMTIHQPAASVFNSLDDLLLLERGRLVYFGQLTRAIAYFNSLNFLCTSSCNPAGMFSSSSSSLCCVPLIRYGSCLIVCFNVFLPLLLVGYFNIFRLLPDAH